MLFGSIKIEETLLSTARTTPSFVLMPTEDDPSLIASIAYSTYKRRPSGENVFTPLSYSLLLPNIIWCVINLELDLSESDLALSFGETEGDKDSKKSKAMARPFGVALLIGGVDETGPCLYHTDPSGTMI